MKFKNYDFNLQSIPSLNTVSGQVYHKFAVIDYAKHFESLLPSLNDTIHYLANLQEQFISEETILHAFDIRDIRKQAEADELARKELMKEQRIQAEVARFSSAFAVNIPEFNNAVFVVPFNTEELPEKMQKRIPGEFSIQELAGIYERVNFIDGKSITEYGLDQESAKWIIEGLARNEIYKVSVARVSDVILELSKNYVKKLSEAVVDVK